MPETQKLIIDWTQMITYNTIMSLAAGAGLMAFVRFLKTLHSRDKIVPDGWALTFGLLSFILVITGLHMTLTWPLAKDFPYDNIIFGETSLGFGVLLGAASFFLWKKGSQISTTNDNPKAFAEIAEPSTTFVLGLGLALFGIAIAGVYYQLFAAPAEEPISGMFHEYPLVEAVFVSGMFATVGLGCVLFPSALKNFSKQNQIAVKQLILGWCWYLGGLGFFLFGAMNYFTHIGLIVNTMK